jgi:hypothetical protein
MKISTSHLSSMQFLMGTIYLYIQYCLVVLLTSIFRFICFPQNITTKFIHKGKGPRVSIMQNNEQNTFYTLCRILGSHSGSHECCHDIVPCSPYVNWHFGGTHHLHIQCQKSAEQETNVQQEVISSSEMSVHIRTTRPCSSEYYG